MKLRPACEMITDVSVADKSLVVTWGDGTRKSWPLVVEYKEVTSVQSSVSVSFSPIVTSGTALGTLTVGAAKYTIYAPTQTSTTYSNATSSSAGLMSAADKAALSRLSTSLSVSYTPSVTSGVKLGTLSLGTQTATIYAPAATAYTLPAATSSTLGGVKIGANISNDSGKISISKANVIAALGYSPLQTMESVSQMVPSDNYVDIYKASAVQNYSADFRLMQYVPPSNGYCSITGKLTVRITDLTNGMDINSFSYWNESSNLGAAVCMPVKAGHTIQFIWHKKAEETTTGTDKFTIRFIPAT